MKKSLVQIVAAFAVLCFSCIENPFGGDNKISGGTRSISGQVKLSNGASAEGAYVWLDGFNIGARANANGDFTLTLPSAGSQGGGATGVYQLYFFCANYRIMPTASVTTRNGAFLYGQGDINKNGALYSAKTLERFLRVSTQVTPSTVAANFTGTITVETTLEATIDTATVVFPNTIAGLLGAVLVRRVGTNEVYIFQAAPGADGVEVQRISRSATKRGMNFNFINASLPPGDYEVIPYILIRRQQVPSLLMASLGASVELLGPGYINLPMKREGGQFKVTP